MIIRIVKNNKEIYNEVDARPENSGELIECNDVIWGRCKVGDEGNQSVDRISYVGDFYDFESIEGYMDVIKDSYGKTITVRYFIKDANVFVMNNEGKTIHRKIFE
jgi:hypothetical protein